MIHQLSLAFELNQRYHRSEFVVTRQVFLEALRLGRSSVEPSSVHLNGPHLDSRYKFASKFTWRGMAFICLSQKPLVATARH